MTYQSVFRADLFAGQVIIVTGGAGGDGFKSGGIGGGLLDREERSLAGLAAGIADESGAATDEDRAAVAVAVTRGGATLGRLPLRRTPVPRPAVAARRSTSATIHVCSASGGSAMANGKRSF